MSPLGRPKGEYRRAQHEGACVSPLGRPKGEYRRAQHEGAPVRPPDGLVGGKPGLCLFDLDHTLLPIDSDHAWGDFVIGLGWVDPAAFKRGNDRFYEQYRQGRLDIHAYVDFASEPLRRQSAPVLAEARRRFMTEVIGPVIRNEAKVLVEAHRSRGDRLAIVTSTNDFVTAPIAAAFGIDTLIATRLERDIEGRITGRIDGTPAHREGKVERVGQWLAESGDAWGDFYPISVYSDSLNDVPLLEAATDAVATNPSPELEAIARRRGWRIVHLFPT